MNSLIVFDSVFGNTEQIASAIAGALGTDENIKLLRVNEASVDQIAETDVLIVGSPTRGFRATAATTHFLKQIPRNGLKGVKVAAFDTRISEQDIDSTMLRFMMKKFGYAASPIATRLRKKGGRLILPPEGFIVADTEGPLKDGELDRAVAWADKILTEFKKSN
ncbi:flavodoxin family protein [candidate division KSB1 bacterium]|nr:flavodoxin family protein [candidate division KSB1 bacterium]